MVDKARTFRDLKIWKLAVELVKTIYACTRRFPREELYGLSSQMRRAAVSIPSNMAEGFRRKHNNEYRQFLYIAFGSCAELETQACIAKELGYIDIKQESNLNKQIDQICAMTMSLIKKL